MIYDLLKDIRDHLACKATPDSEEQELLSRLEKAISTAHRSDDTDYLQPDEILVRICAGTKRPVLVCHTGNGSAVCLHNDSVEEDAEDIRVWLETGGRECNGNRHLSLENETDLDSEFEKVIESEEIYEAFIDTVIEGISSDDDSYRHKAFNLIKAYRSGDCDGILMALCGWSMKTLLEKCKQKTEQ